MTFADQLARESKKGARNEAARKRREKVAEAKKALETAKNERAYAERVWEDFKKKTVKAARSKKERSATDMIIFAGDDSPSYEFCERIRKLAVADGFKEDKIGFETRKDDPVGSDPMFFHTVYHTFLTVEW